MPALAVLLTDGFADWEAGPLMAISRGYMGIDVTTVSPGGLPVVSMGGLRVAPEQALEALQPDGFDGLAIIGGSIWETEQAPDIGPALRAFRRRDRVVGGICGGTLAIARTGILRGIAHTSNSRAFLSTSEHYHGHASYLDVPFAVRDGHLITASGMAPISFAREILAALGRLTPEADGYLAAFGNEHSFSANPLASGRLAS